MNPSSDSHPSSRSPLGLPLLAAVFSILPPLTPLAWAQTDATYKGRPFVKVLAKGDPIPGTPGANFGVIERFTLRDGVIHIVAGENANKKGLFRWTQGTLTKLVYTDTPSPTGGTFDTVHFTTDETEGALNFVGEIFFGKPGFVYGLFEWRNGVITKVFDTAEPVDGKSLAGLGYPVRVGHEVVGNSQFFENGVMKVGILKWDGTHLHTIIQSGDDLPGSLGGFTGQPGRYQIAFDGRNVGFVASADPQGKPPHGIYRAGSDGVITKIVDGYDPYPYGGTYNDAGLEFVNVDVDGDFAYAGLGDMVVASGQGNSFYQGPLRYTGGTLSPTVSPWGSDGAQEEALPFYAPGSQPLARATVAGKVWTGFRMVDAQGDDVALHLRFEDFSEGIYAALGGGSAPPKAPTLAQPVVAKGRITLRFASTASANYRIEFKGALTDTTWRTQADLKGTGADLEYSETTATAGFYRVTVLP